jgi:hypothetical protein
LQKAYRFQRMIRKRRAIRARSRLNGPSTIIRDSSQLINIADSMSSAIKRVSLPQASTGDSMSSSSTGGSTPSPNDHLSHSVTQALELTHPRNLWVSSRPEKLMVSAGSFRPIPTLEPTSFSCWSNQSWVSTSSKDREGYSSSNLPLRATCFKDPYGEEPATEELYRKMPKLVPIWSGAQDRLGVCNAGTYKYIPTRWIWFADLGGVRSTYPLAVKGILYLYFYRLIPLFLK